jgi:hypothetical protein
MPGDLQPRQPLIHLVNEAGQVYAIATTERAIGTANERQ